MEPTVRPVREGNSFFAFVEDFCFEERYEGGVNRPFHRLCSLMRKMKARSAIVETVTSPPVMSEWSAINETLRDKVEIEPLRVTFVTKDIADPSDAGRLEDDDFLASAIVMNYKKPDGHWKSYIFSAIVSEPRIVAHPRFGNLPLLNNYLHVRRVFNAEVGKGKGMTHTFRIRGSFFCQQNTLTSVCAHAALCMTVNNMNPPDSDLIFPEEINKAIGIDHVGAKVSGGLEKAQIETVLEKFGLTTDWRDFISTPGDYKDYVYKYVESKCPVILGFGVSDTVAHVIPILGHTLNTDQWAPEAVSAYSYSPLVSRVEVCYKPVHLWVDHFIIHDDNFGMYFCLPSGTLKQPDSPPTSLQFRACYAIAIIPSFLTTEAWEAEVAAQVNVANLLEFFKVHSEPDQWTKRLIASTETRPPRPLLVRTFLTSRDEYARSLHLTDFAGAEFTEQERAQIVEDLPDSFWLSEITLPELYTANKTKLIDFFYTCQAPKIGGNYDLLRERWIQMRFPGVLFKRGMGKMSAVPLSVESHYPLLRSADEVLLEW